MPTALRDALLSWVRASGDNAFEQLGHYGPKASGLHPSRAVSASGLNDIGPLLRHVFEAAPTARLDDAPLRAALAWLPTQVPTLNLGGRDVSAFCDEMSACIRCALNHARRMKGNPSKMRQALITANCCGI